MRRRNLLFGIAAATGLSAAGFGYRHWSLRDVIQKGNLSDYKPTEDYDVCIVGSGPAGCTLARRLSAEGKRVLILESGVALTDSLRMQAAMKLDAYTSSGALDYPVQSTRIRALGGTSTIWTGRCPRMLPSDFTNNPLAPGGSWPLSYAELQPYYRAAEKTLYVAGDKLTESQAPRNEDLPEKAIMDISQMRALIGPLGIAIDHPPTSNKRRIFEGAGPLRSDRDQLPSLSRRSNADLLEDATATRVLLDQRGLVTGIKVRSVSGGSQEVKAKRYVLAGGGLESTRLLLMSGNEHFPGGVGNHAGHLGRYFMEHPFVTYKVDMPSMEPFQGWQLGRTYTYSDSLRGKGLGGMVLAFYGNPKKPRQLKIAIGIEMAPSVGNRIRLDANKVDSFGDPGADVALDFSDLDRQLLSAGEEIVQGIIGRLGGENVKKSDTLKWSGHHIGTTRMSVSAADGVVDPKLRVHGTENLYVLSSSAFVTSGAANPTLTIVALAHRLADHLLTLET